VNFPSVFVGHLSREGQNHIRFCTNLWNDNRKLEGWEKESGIKEINT